MARPIWSGSISFGLVNVPVKLYSATSSHRVGFHQFQRGTGQRIRYRRVAEDSGKEVDWDDIVKGYEVEKGEYVIIEPEELEKLEPTRSRTIEIEEFVRLDEIDPISWNKTYYLAPREEVGAERPYLLLRKALERTGRVAIARFVMRSKQYLATIRPLGRMLGLETMYFADEIRGEEEVENVPVHARVGPRELAIAEQLVESLAAKWEPQKYRDTYHERVVDLIERKARGEQVVVHREEEQQPRIENLMKALRESLNVSRQRKAGGAEVMVTTEKAAPQQRARRRPKQELSRLRKSELLKRAAKADIRGRSKMTKDELVSALEQAA